MYWHSALVCRRFPVRIYDTVLPAILLQSSRNYFIANIPHTCSSIREVSIKASTPFSAAHLAQQCRHCWKHLWNCRLGIIFSIDITFFLAVFHVQKPWSLQCGPNFERVTSNWVQNHVTKEWGGLIHVQHHTVAQWTHRQCPARYNFATMEEQSADPTFIRFPTHSLPYPLQYFYTQVWLTVCSCLNKQASDLFQHLLWIARLSSYPRFADASSNIYATSKYAISCKLCVLHSREHCTRYICNLS